MTLRSMELTVQAESVVKVCNIEMIFVRTG